MKFFIFVENEIFRPLLPHRVMYARTRFRSFVLLIFKRFYRPFIPPLSLSTVRFIFTPFRSRRMNQTVHCFDCLPRTAYRILLLLFISPVKKRCKIKSVIGALFHCYIVMACVLYFLIFTVYFLFGLPFLPPSIDKKHDAASKKFHCKDFETLSSAQKILTNFFSSENHSERKSLMVFDLFALFGFCPFVRKGKDEYILD